MIPNCEPPTLGGGGGGEWSGAFRTFVDRCLVKDPEQRASAHELLAAHRFLCCAAAADGGGSFGQGVEVEEGFAGDPLSFLLAPASPSPPAAMDAPQAAAVAEEERQLLVRMVQRCLPGIEERRKARAKGQPRVGGDAPDLFDSDPEEGESEDAEDAEDGGSGEYFGRGLTAGGVGQGA